MNYLSGKVKDNILIKVSIIIPLYNVELYLHDCLKSVVNQTLSEIEIILINDGSTDESYHIAKDYVEENENMILLNQNNLGQSAARNKGLKHARGKYIYFLDSDDYITNDAMEVLYNIAELYELDLIMFEGNSFYDNDYKLKKNIYDNYKFKHKYPNVWDGKICFNKLILNGDYRCSPCLLFINRSVIIKNNLSFYEGIIHEDELFTFEILLNSKKVKCIDKILFFRRLRQNSTITKKQYTNSFIGTSVVLMNFEKYYNEYTNNKMLKQSIALNMDIIFGNIIYNYTYMNDSERKRNKTLLLKVIEIARKLKYFNRIDYKLFCKSRVIYVFFRKTYDRLNDFRFF